jgi:hypothetical protein
MRAPFQCVCVCVCLLASEALSYVCVCVCSPETLETLESHRTCAPPRPEIYETKTLPHTSPVHVHLLLLLLLLPPPPSSTTPTTSNA